MPELLWKAYIDFEVEEGEREAARKLYERLVLVSGHVKVWISFALFEAEPMPIPRAEREEEEEEQEEEEESEVKMVPGDPIQARQVFERGYKDLKSKNLKNEVCVHFAPRSPELNSTRNQRVALLEVWKTFEEKYGTPEDAAKVQRMMPIVSKRRKVDQETGQTVEGEFCRYSLMLLIITKRHVVDWDLVFADDEREANPTSFKFLQMAQAWASVKKTGGAEGSSMLSGLVAQASKFKKAERRDSDAAMSDVASSEDGED